MVGTAHAEPIHPNHAFLKDVIKGKEGQHQLADLLRKALTADPSGHALVTPDQCNTLHRMSCANPLDFLIAFQKEDKEGAPTDLAALADWVDTLVLKDPIVGIEYFSACLSVEGPTMIHRVITDCESREFHSGEKAWADPKTGKIVLAQDCANPVGAINPPVIVQPNCARIDWPGQGTDHQQIFVVGLSELPKTCTSLKQAGQSHFVKQMPHDCVDPCRGWEGIAVMRAYLKAEVGVLKDPQPSFIQEVDGTNSIQLPMEVTDGKHMVEICRTHVNPDGSLTVYRVGVVAENFVHLEATADHAAEHFAVIEESNFKPYSNAPPPTKLTPEEEKAERDFRPH